MTMLRTKKEVDHHVQVIFRNLQDENERTLRCFKIAELYYHVGDYELSRRYLSRYVEIRKEAKAHKLMGQVLEALGQKEAALTQYKFAFELDARQEDLILKMCELMADEDIGIDINRTKYWVERADKLFPCHKVVFQLKEKILSTENPANNEEDLEKLIKSELTIRPSDIQLRIKLLKHYMEKGKLDKAYKHAMDIEATSIHRNSMLWYQVLCELFLKCKNSKQNNWAFWITYISSLERYGALCLKEQGNILQKTSEAMQAIYNFDQQLFEAKSQGFASYPSLTENIFMHMWGQLHFHMACLLLQNTKREQSSWNEAGRLSAPLLLTAMHVKPIDLTASWATHVDSSLKNQLQLWYYEGSYRCSQAGHVLHDYSRTNQKKLISNIEKFCSSSWRERIYQRIFVGKIYQKVSSSYFTNNNVVSPPLRLVSSNEMRRFDEVAEEVYPYSLHHQIWPAVKCRNSTSTLHSNKYEGPQPNLSSHLFPELQFSVYNLNQASPVTLSRLDIDSFLNLAALCACTVVEEQQRNNLLSPDRLPTLPADLINPMCSDEQEKWWSTAYKMYRKEQLDNTGDTRQILQRGLEVVRCIGNHGLHPVLLIHLARIFQHKAKQLKEKNPDSGDIPAVEARSELYWSAAIPLLERLQNNQTIRSSHVKLFIYIGKELNNMQITHAIEEGKLLLAQKLVKDKHYQQAIEDLQALKCAEASFEQGKIYKKLADETMENLPKESVTSEMRSQHIIILSKARNCFYLTLDRLRSPDADPKHPLNAELSTYIASVENELKRIDPDTLCNDRNRRDCDDLSEESYSSAHSEEHPTVTNSLPILNNSLQTPIRNIRRTPRQSSTPRHDFLDVSRSRSEARPSPERLDAQIRQLVHSIDSLKDQNKEQHRAMMSKLDELIRSNTRTENVNVRTNTQMPMVNQNLEDDLYGIYTHEDYRDYNNYSSSTLSSVGNRTSALPQNLFTPARHPYPPMMYASPAMAVAALQNYYQGHLGFPDPATAAAAAAAAVSQQMSGLYPGTAASGAYSMSSLYPRGGLEQPLSSMQRMSDNILNPGVFAQRINNQFSDYSQTLPNQQVSSTQQLGQQISQLQLNEQNKTESKLSFTPASETCIPESSILTKENVNSSTTTAVRKSPPINVVITTSDTLPTSAPIMPMLSVTIPAQHRLGVSTSTASCGPIQDPLSVVPHSYQISMPSQPTIPTTVNLPPLSTKITTVTSPIVHANVSDQTNTSVLSTSSRHSCSDATEIEHDPIPDFAPIIPLPDEVPVTTGEENEEEIFCARAKLYRFVEKEWKERGTGKIKLLKNVDGKVRLLMRREQVHKICANHILTKDMELNTMPNTDKAYIWVANDFADEVVKLEKLCVRFKTAEEAASFKDNFDKAKNSLPECTDQMENSNSIEKSVKAEANNKKLEDKIGGFTFTSEPIFQKSPISETSKLIKKPQETFKPSPFAKFSFAETPDRSQMPPRASGSFNMSGYEVPAFHRKEINETTHIGLEASMTHFQETNKPEYGEGIIKIVTETLSGKIRIMMDKADHSKILINEVITPTVSFSLKAETINWSMPSDKINSYSLRFKSRDQAANFYKIITNMFEKSTKSNTKMNPPATEQKPLSELFKPATGSWECKDCYTRNDANVTHCIACQAVSPSTKNQQVITPAPTSAPISNKPLSEMFKPAAGSWECTSCYTRNSQSNQYCVACDIPKDPSMPPKPKTIGGFSINSETSDTKSNFSFGIPQATQQTPAKESQGFSFSMSKLNQTVSSPIPIFGSNKSMNMPSGFSFGSQTPSTPPSSTAGGPFTFGSPGKSFDFHFQAKSPTVKSPERPETSDEEVVEEAEDVYFAPAIPLPDKIDVKTGEENEDVLYSHRAKLFKFDSNTKEWKERGIGDIKLLRHTETKKLRLVMRRDQVLKLCLNHAVTGALEITQKDDRTWRWSAGDYSEGEIEYIHFACRFKTYEVAEEFKKAVDDACNAIKSESNNTTAIKKESSSKMESSPELEVIYQAQVTPEEKAAAAKLKLPDNFYAYKYNSDCPGCIGCKDELADSFFKDDVGKTKQPIMKLRAPTFKAKESVPSDITSQPFLSNAFTKPTSNLVNPTQQSAIPTVVGVDKNIFENGSAGAKPTFVFGKQSVKPTLNPETVLENTKICSPSSKSESSSITANAAPTMFSGFGVSSISTAMSSEQSKLTSSGTPLESEKFGSSIFSAEANKNTSGQLTNIFSTPTNLQTTNIFNSTSNLFGASTTAAPGNIFGTNTTAAPTNMFGTNTTASINIFSTNTTAAPTSIFGTKTTTASMFGGQTSVTPIFSPLTAKVNAQGSQLGSFSTVFDSPSTAPSLNTKPTIPGTTTPVNSSTFGGVSSLPKLNFGTSNSSLPTNNIFSGTKSDSTSENIFMIKPTENSSKTEGVTFLPTENSVSFSDLAAQVSATQKPSFQTDPNFTFEGAGASVFSVKTDKKTDSKKALTKSSSPNVKTEKVNNDEEEEEENNENGDEHDPHFEPIIPLPDTIEVRTGEEDEKKVFCERAKLYRYDNDTREWKERGVGEMKLLHHAGQGTYRLLLRREQVHKVVCNLLLTPEIEFLTLNSSDRAWMWAGMNYAESDNPQVEKLAVRFKSPELSAQFKEAVNKAQQALAEKHNQVCSDSLQDENYGDEYADDDEYVNDEEDEENEENEDEEENSSMFENGVTLYAQNEGDIGWSYLGEGDLKVLYDSELLGAKIVVESSTKGLITETIISTDMKMTCTDTLCTWAGIDYALNPPITRTLKADFKSMQASKEMYEIFQEGQECATKAEIRG